MAFPAFLDACVLVPIRLADLLLRLAEADTYRLLWSGDVLAAAVRGDAAVIVTANTKDFPAEALKPYDIDAVHPDDFLLDQLDLYPALTVRCLREQIADYRNPQVTAQEFIDRFARTVPRFADEVRSALYRS